MNTALTIIWVFAAFSPFVTYFALRKRWDKPKLSKAYIGKYLWILRIWLFPLISIYVLMAFGIRAFCVALLIIILVSVILRLYFFQSLKWTKISIISLGVSMPLIAISYAIGEPFWVQIRLTILGVIWTGFSLLSAILDKPEISLFKTKLNKASFSDKIWRWVNIGLAVLGGSVILLNEYFRREYSVEIWALFDAYGGIFVVFGIGLFSVIFIPIFVHDEDKNELKSIHSNEA